MKWYAVAVMVLLVALLCKLALLAYAMYALLGILWVSRWLAQQWGDHLEAERSFTAQEAQVGDVITITITVQNRGHIPIVWVLLEDVLPREALMFDPPRLEVLGTRLVLISLRRSQTYTMTYQVRCHRRGYYQIGPFLAETGDLLGLHRRFRLLTLPHYLLVEPAPLEIQGYALESRRPVGEVQMSHRLFEDPSRLSGCRVYQPGDPLQRIHWPATARTGTLQTKVFEPSSVAGAMLLLDFDRRRYDRRHEPVRSELAITTAASLAHDLVRNGQPVGLVSNGRDAAERVRTEGWKGDLRTRSAARQQATQPAAQDHLRPLRVPPSRSPQACDDLLKLLARLELNEGLSLPDLVRETGHDLPRDTTVIAIISGVEPAEAVALGELRRRGYAVTALVNVYDQNLFATAAARLASVHVAARHLRDHEYVSIVCQRITVRGTDR